MLFVLDFEGFTKEIANLTPRSKLPQKHREPDKSERTCKFKHQISDPDLSQ